MHKLSGLRPQALYAPVAGGLTDSQVDGALKAALTGLKPGLRRVLLVPPDATRPHAKAGLITQLLYRWLSPGCQVDILPALGTHVPLNEQAWRAMFPVIPFERMLVHDWRHEVVQVGLVPGGLVSELSNGLMADDIPVQVSRHVLNPAYDLIISIGQVVPHEVVGMANHSKNIFIGCGGAGVINATHMLGAVCGIETILGRDRNPVRAVLDYMAQEFAAKLPLCYALTVTTAQAEEVCLHGLFINSERRAFEQAVALSREKNITRLKRPIPTCVVTLDEMEFQSTWLGNKAIYRTRMAMQDGGELIILAPGVRRFGEDGAVDALIRKYGYRGRDAILQAVADQADLRGNLSAAAHLILSSSEGRFRVTYCTRHLSRAEVEGVGYSWQNYEEAAGQYGGLQPGLNLLDDGREVYFIRYPALGLWMLG
ncbi:MAG: DUF2088 domain-containing protein [Clostridiales bacterium]|nr:DUF2088 domain-containing protein [Clostridiales bacterium]